eukprot:757379-Hanusia_phi.AAC.14
MYPTHITPYPLIRTRPHRDPPVAIPPSLTAWTRGGGWGREATTWRLTLSWWEQESGGGSEGRRKRRGEACESKTRWGPSRNAGRFLH